MKIDIEFIDGWWDYNVYYKKRHLCGTASHLKDALDSVLDASERITKELKNPRRNP